MGKISDIPSLADLAGLKGEIVWLESLVQLGEHWRDIARGINSRFADVQIDSPGSLLTFLLSTLEDASVIEAFDTLGLASLRVDLLGFVKDVSDKVPSEVKKLASQVSNFGEAEKTLADDERPLGFRDDWVGGDNSGEVRLPIPALALAQAGTKGRADYHLELEAEAVLACEAGALWPYRRDAVTPGLVQLTLAGRVQVGAKGSLPFQSGKLGAEAEAGIGAGVMFFYRPKSADSIFAAEVARILPRLPNPFSLKSVFDAAATDRLEGVIAALDGHAEVSVSVSVGRELDLPKVLSGALSVTGSVSLKRKAGYVLSVRAAGTDTRKLLVALSRNKSASDNWKLGLGLELDISPLVDRVYGVLEKALGKWSEQLEKIRPYLTPGTWIRTELSEELAALAKTAIKDKDLRDGALQDLGLLLGTSEAEDSALVSALVKKIGDKLNTVSGLAFGEAKGLTTTTVDEIVGALPSFAQDQARQLLMDRIEPLIGQYQAKLTSELDAIAKKKPTDIGSALKSVGITLDKEIKKADEALAGLRKLIERVDAILHEMVEKTADAAMKKIALQLAFEAGRDREMDMEVVGTFDRWTEEGQALYASLAQGKLSALQKLLDPKNTVPGFELDRKKSSIRRFTEVSRKVGFTFVGFGVELSASQLLSGEADLKVLGNGDVAVSVKADLEKSAIGPREGRSVTLVSAYSLLLAKAEDDDGQGRDPSLQQSLSFEFTASHRDKSLKAGEVTGFLSRLQQFGLVNETRTKAADNIYETWTAAGGSNASHPAGDLDIRMTLDSQDLDGLLALGKDILADLEAKSLANTRTVLGTALDAMLETQRLSKTELFDNIADARERGFGPENDDFSDREWLMHYVQSARVTSTNVAKHRRTLLNAKVNDDPKMRSLMNAMIYMSSLADILQLMWEIYDATPADAQGKGGWDDAKYATHEKLLAEASAGWIDLNNEWIFWFRDEIGRRTVAFLLALVAIARGDGVARVIEEDLGDSLFEITLTKRFGPENEQIPMPV